MLPVLEVHDTVVDEAVVSIQPLTVVARLLVVHFFQADLAPYIVVGGLCLCCHAACAHRCQNSEEHGQFSAERKVKLLHRSVSFVFKDVCF